MMTDIEIAQAHTPKKITEIAAAAGIDEKYLELYGNYKAKIDPKMLNETNAPDGKLILVTAITPTPAGEGKTTVSTNLAAAMAKSGKRVLLIDCDLRNPSVAKTLKLPEGSGLAEFLSERKPAREVIKATEVENLWVIAGYQMAMGGAAMLAIGALTGGISATAGGISAAIVFGFIAALFFKPKDK